MIEPFLLDALDLVLGDAEAGGDELARADHADILILCLYEGQENLHPPRFRQKLFHVVLRHRKFLLSTPIRPDAASSSSYPKCITASLPV
jgi:hypothetical protein